MVLSHIDFALPDQVENLTLASLAVVGEGNDLNNSVAGTDTANTLLGGGGDDVLLGRGGRDILDGGDGNDTIDGGLGKDTLTGGGGADAFKFRDGDTASGRFGADLITDFDQAEGDEIRLSLVDADTTLDGNQRFTWVADGAFTGVAGQLRYVQANGMTYVEGDTNGDSIADIVIALNGLIDLTTADFTF